MHNSNTTNYIFVIQKNDLAKLLPQLLLTLHSLFFLIPSETRILFDFLHEQITRPKLLVLSPHLL